MKNFILFLSLSMLFGCASRPPVIPNAFKFTNLNELNIMYENKEVGVLEFSTSDDFDGPSNVRIYSAGDLNMEVGNIRAGEGYRIYLPERAYSLLLSLGSGKLVHVNFVEIKAGQTLTYKWDKAGDSPYKVSSMQQSVKVLAEGSIYEHYKLKTLNQEALLAKKPKFDVHYKEVNDKSIAIKLLIFNWPSIEKILINDVDRTKRFWHDNGEQSIEDLKVGMNSFEIKVINKEGFDSSKSFVVNVLSQKEKKEIAEKNRQERIQIEKAAIARKKEEEKIAKEGDGSPDDLLCKKYGLKPQTNGYAECRMRIDFSKIESKRQQEQYERDQAEYQRQQAEYQRQLSIIEKEKERRRDDAFMELGARIRGGQSPLNALGSLGTGAPIAPTRPTPINQTITLPNGRMINCRTVGSMTDCF